MKFTLSVAVLALAASQAVAVVPIPIKGCTRTVVVQPTDTGCQQFADANGCKLSELLAWNTKLRTDCANLDVGAPLCVSITAGGGNHTTGPVTTVPSTNGTALPTNGTAKPTTPAVVNSTTSTSAPVTAPTTPTKPASGANGNKASLVLGAAGVLLSVVYML
ncbi:hypothetical protein BGX26_000166 [Mortierella sp. AD094]|nr:hypothetical protein BGX26_000166 [Mortierella sp. AD094]